MTLHLRHIKKCQWNRGWYVQLTEWIKPITMSKLKFKWICFPHGAPSCSLSLRARRRCNAGDEHQAHVSCLLAQMPNHIRQKRQSHLSLCTLCCNCCRGNKGCGFCCKFWRSPPRPQNINLFRLLSYPEKWPFLDFRLRCIARTLFC